METKIRNFKRHLAFTLAEVLIVMSIIGIVAEMTIPTLIHNIQEQVLKTSFKKAYSEASQAWEQVVAENPGTYTARGGWTCTWPDSTTADYDANDGRIDALKAKMKVIKSCVNETGCWPKSYEKYGDFYGCGNNPENYSWVTADGTMWGTSCKNHDETNIAIDINGNKQPNKIGQDIFQFLLGSDGIVYFTIGDNSTTGNPVSSGHICPFSSDPATINGRSVSFQSLLYN